MQRLKESSTNRCAVKAAGVFTLLLTFELCPCRLCLPAPSLEWSQMYGDERNSNYTPCYLGPPLIALWHSRLPAYPTQTLVAEGVIAQGLCSKAGGIRNWAEPCGLSAASGDLLWGPLEVNSDWRQSGLMIPHFIKSGHVFGERPFFEHCTKRPTFESLDLATGTPTEGIRVAWTDGEDLRLWLENAPTTGWSIKTRTCMVTGAPATVMDDYVIWTTLVEDEPAVVLFVFSISENRYRWYSFHASPSHPAKAIPTTPGLQPVETSAPPSGTPNDSSVAWIKPATNGYSIAQGTDANGWIAVHRSTKGNLRAGIAGWQGTDVGWPYEWRAVERRWMIAATSALWRARPGDTCPYKDTPTLPDTSPAWVNPDKNVDRRPGYSTFGSPALYGDLAIFPVGDGGLAAYELYSGHRRWVFKDGIRRNPGEGPARVGNYAPKGMTYEQAVFTRPPSQPDTPRTTPALAPGAKAVLFPSEDGWVYCLDALTGRVRWRQPWIPATTTELSGLIAPIVAPYDRGEVAYVRGMDGLYVFDVATGTRLDGYPLPPGIYPPAAAYGALYVTSGFPQKPTQTQFRIDSPDVAECGVTSFAPALRLYRLGFEGDISKKADNQPAWPEDVLPPAFSVEVRLDEQPDLSELARQVYWERSARCSYRPLMLSLRWLDESTKHLLVPDHLIGKDFTDRIFREHFLNVCGNLAQALQPESFDLGPECNFYLHEQPGGFRSFLDYLGTLRDRVKNVSPRTQVFVSFQYELWQAAGRRRKQLGPLGPEVELKPQSGLTNQFAGAVDGYGVWTDPSITLEKSSEVPLDSYYAPLKAIKKPLFSASIARGKDNAWGDTCRIERFFHQSYWLDRSSQFAAKEEEKTNDRVTYGLIAPLPEALRVEVSLADPLDIEDLSRRVDKVRTINGVRTTIIVGLRWLDKKKKALVLPPNLAGRGFDDAEVQSLFVGRCVELARALKPDCLDIGPECNFYLQTAPEAFLHFVKACAAARNKIKAASPVTKTMVSFQYELWQGWKQRRKNLGSVSSEAPLKTQYGLANQFDTLVDCIGIWSDPTVVFERPFDIPLDYYYRLADATRKPLIFTGIGWPTTKESRGGEQAEFIETFFRRIYWLDPLAVVWTAYDIDLAEATGRPGYELVGDAGLDPLRAWQDIYGWRPVSQRAQPGPPIRLKPVAEGF